MSQGTLADRHAVSRIKSIENCVLARVGTGENDSGSVQAVDLDPAEASNWTSTTSKWRGTCMCAEKLLELCAPNFKDGFINSWALDDFSLSSW